MNYLTPEQIKLYVSKTNDPNLKGSYSNLSSYLGMIKHYEDLAQKQVERMTFMIAQHAVEHI